MPQAPFYSFAKGEASNRLHARADLDSFRLMLRTCRNFLVMRQGGLTKRPGTIFVAETKNATGDVRIEPFVFSTAQSYVLEIGDQYIRFHNDSGTVMDGGSPYEVATPWVAADVDALDFTQSNDVVYFVHPDYPPQKLQRFGETDWTLEEVEFTDGPYLDIPKSRGKVQISATGNIIPDMTSGTAPSGTAQAISFHAAGVEAWRAFDRDAETEWRASRGANARPWVEYEFSTAKVVSGYMLQASGKETVIRVGTSSTDYNVPGHLRAPRSWVLQGTNSNIATYPDGGFGSPVPEADWVILDQRVGETGWGDGERRYYSFTNSQSFVRYRFVFWDTNTSESQNIDAISISEIAFQGSGADEQSITLTFSDISEVNGGDGFTSADIGRQVRLMNEDGQWHWLVISSITSTNIVVAKLKSPPLPSVKAITTWRLGAFSEASGYPGTVSFFKNRLFYGRTATRPQTAYGSVDDDYDNFEVSTPLKPEDAMTVTIGAAGEIQWMADLGSLMIATVSAIWPLGVADRTQGFSATNIELGRPIRVGSSDISPVQMQDAVVFVNQYRTALHELIYSPESNSFVAPDISIMSDHLFRGKVDSLSYVASPDGLIAGGRDDGGAFSGTYERDQKMNAFHAPEFGGDPDLVDVCAIPTLGRDQMWFLFDRDFGRTIEYLAPIFDDLTTDIEDAIFVDCAFTVTGPGISSATGLPFNNGTVVDALADGVPYTGLVVSGGAASLPSGVTADKITVGLPYSARGETMRLLAGQGGASTLGRKKSVSAVIMDFIGTGQCKVRGRGTNYEESILRAMTDPMDAPPPLFTGEKRIPIDDRHTDQFGGSVQFVSDLPLPCTIRAIVPVFDGEP